MSKSIQLQNGKLTHRIPLNVLVIFSSSVHLYIKHELHDFASPIISMKFLSNFPAPVTLSDSLSSPSNNISSPTTLSNPSPSSVIIPSATVPSHFSSIYSPPSSSTDPYAVNYEYPVIDETITTNSYTADRKLSSISSPRTSSTSLLLLGLAVGCATVDVNYTVQYFYSDLVQSTVRCDGHEVMWCDESGVVKFQSCDSLLSGNSADTPIFSLSLSGTVLSTSYLSLPNFTLFVIYMEDGVTHCIERKRLGNRTETSQSTTNNQWMVQQANWTDQDSIQTATAGWYSIQEVRKTSDTPRQLFAIVCCLRMNVCVVSGVCFRVFVFLV